MNIYVIVDSEKYYLCKKKINNIYYWEKDNLRNAIKFNKFTGYFNILIIKFFVEFLYKNNKIYLKEL